MSIHSRHLEEEEEEEAEEEEEKEKEEETPRLQKEQGAVGWFGHLPPAEGKAAGLEEKEEDVKLVEKAQGLLGAEEKKAAARRGLEEAVQSKDIIPSKTPWKRARPPGSGTRSQQMPRGLWRRRRRRRPHQARWRRPRRAGTANS